LLKGATQLVNLYIDQTDKQTSKKGEACYMLYNLTPHSVDIYPETAFINLVKVNATTLVADSVEGKAVESLPSIGNLRIKTATLTVDMGLEFPTVKTEYGELEGLPPIDFKEEDILIVSLPTQSMCKAAGHPLAMQMATPYKVVRLASNTSTVLGCVGLSFQ